jgi:nucleoside-diphosphate-sugar epimerase
MKNRAVLVTGATGFVGRYVVDCLLGKGLHVSVLTRGNGTGVLFSNGQVETVTGDITRDFVIPEGITTVYHCAGVINKAEEMEAVNIGGTSNVAEASLKHNCRLVHLSSAGTVGMTKRRMLDEETPCNPQSLYEKTKLEAEMIVKRAIERGLKAQILRPTTVFGLGWAPELDSLLQLVRAIVSGTYRHIRGGRGIYNIIYAGEVARAMVTLDSDTVPNGGVYLINTPITFSDFTSIVQRSVGKNAKKIANIPSIVALSVAAIFSFLYFLGGKKKGLTFSRFKALTDMRVFSQERLLRETDYRPLCSVGEYLERLCKDYSCQGLLG